MSPLPPALLTLLLATPALAATDWAAYGSFAGTRCEDPQTIADIRASLDTLEFNEGGGAAFGLASSVRITASRTVSASERVLVCRLRLETIEAGDIYTYNARHTVRLDGAGGWRTEFQPNY